MLTFDDDLPTAVEVNGGERWFEVVRSILDEADYIDMSGERDVDPGGLDYIVKVTGSGRSERVVWWSDQVEAWARSSENAARLTCIARLAQPMLNAQPGDFDVDPLMINLQNGTLVLLPPEDGFAAEARLRAPRRSDRITKLAGASYRPKAKAASTTAR